MHLSILKWALFSLRVQKKELILVFSTCVQDLHYSQENKIKRKEPEALRENLWAVPDPVRNAQRFSFSRYEWRSRTGLNVRHLTLHCPYWNTIVVQPQCSNSKPVWFSFGVTYLHIQTLLFQAVKHNDDFDYPKKYKKQMRSPINNSLIWCYKV